jgi:hypothetical protein
MSDYCKTTNEQFFSYVLVKTSYIIWDDDDVHFVLDKQAYLELHSAISLTQQSAGTYVASHSHIILFPRQPVFALVPLYCVLRGETVNTNCIVFGLTGSVLEPIKTKPNVVNLPKKIKQTC